MEETESKWLQRARSAFAESTTYFDSSIRSQMEKDIRQFNSVHPSGSKYHSDAYKGRSKLFRPKTRSAIRRNEAIAAAAFFSSQDVISTTPQDDNDPLQSASAAVMKELLQYRLTKTIPWFLTVIGAYQEAMKVGVVASYQEWQFDEKRGVDRPWIELEAPENLRIAPNAKWYDPINTSPYVIRMIPMYVKDIEHRMNTVDKKTGKSKWRKYERGQILAARGRSDDSIRQAREGNARVDPKQNETEINDFSVIWVHQNFIDIDGEDYVFFTLGAEHILTDPQPIKEVYFHGKRPIVMGMVILEAHKTYSSSQCNLGAETQREINEIANQRIDNVRFAMNKRYFAVRGRQIDLRSLTRNVPSSVTLMNSTDDVKVIETKDVTGSSYQEQDRLNNDFDELMGHFSGSSVNSNRKLNETVGGLEMLTDDANQVSEYQLRTFVETWVEPVLRQLMMLEREYETDEVILKLAGRKAEIIKNYDIADIDDALMEQELTVTVNVGIGAVNPAKQVEKFVYAMKALRELMGDEVLQKIKPEEVITELFGKLGYKDGARFFDIGEESDAKVQELMGIIEELQQALANKQDPPELIKAKVDEIYSKIAERNVTTLKVGVEAQYAAMQTAGVVASSPEIGEVADRVLANADPGAQQYNEFGDAEPPMPTGPISEMAFNGQQNTSPMLPPVTQEADSPMGGVETQELADSGQ